MHYNLTNIRTALNVSYSDDLQTSLSAYQHNNKILFKKVKLTGIFFEKDMFTEVRNQLAKLYAKHAFYFQSTETRNYHKSTVEPSTWC